MRVAALAALFVVATVPCAAQTIDALLAEVDAARQAHFDRYGVPTVANPDATPPLSQPRDTAYFVIRATGFHDRVRAEIADWRYVIWDGAMTEEEVVALLEPSLASLAQLDTMVANGLSAYVSIMQRYVAITDRAEHVGLSPQTCETYYALLDQAAPLPGRARDAVPLYLGQVSIVPQPGEDRRPAEEVVAALPRGPIDPADQASRLAEVLARLTAAGLPADDPLASVLRVAEWQAEAAELPLPAFLTYDDAAQPVGALRVASAQRMLLERMALLAPTLVPETGTPAAADVRRIVDVVQRLRQLQEDVVNPASGPSVPLRVLHALRATADALAASDEGPTTAEAVSIINDTVAALSRGPVSANAVYGPQQGAVAGIVETTRQGYGHATVALDAMAEYVRTGDPAAYRRMMEAVQRTEAALQPRQFIRNAAAGALQGWASNVPGLRTFLDELIDDLLPPEDAEATASDWRCS